VLSCILKEFFLWINPGGLVSREGAYVVPESFSRLVRSTRATTAMVVDDFGSSWGWEGGHYFTAKGERVWRQMPQIILQCPYSGIGFCDDPEMILPSGEVFDRQGMMLFVLVFYLFLDSIAYGGYLYGW